MIEQLRDLLHYPLNDRGRDNFDYDRLIVVDRGERGYDIVLRLDGGYAHPRDADAARAYCQGRLDALFDAIDREAR